MSKLSENELRRIKLSKELADSGRYDDALPIVVEPDYRYPNHDGKYKCIDSFVQNLKCKDRYGDDYNPCKYFEYVYKKACPVAWLPKMIEAVENDYFYYYKKPKIRESAHNETIGKSEKCN